MKIEDIIDFILLYKVVSVFLSVPKDLANRWTDIVLLYSEASYRFWEGFKLFLERVSSPHSPKIYFFLFFWNSNLIWDEVDFSPS